MSIFHCAGDLLAHIDSWSSQDKGADLSSGCHLINSQGCGYAEKAYKVQEADAWEWKSLRLDDERHLRPFFDESLCWASSCEAYFSDLIHRPYPASYTIVTDLLLVRRWEDTSGKWVLLPPLFAAWADDTSMRIAALMQAALQIMPGSSFDVVSDKYMGVVGDRLATLGLTAELTDPAEWDYIYSSQELIALDSSKSMREKRRQASIFEKDNSPTVIPLSPGSWSESVLQRCRAVAEGWVKENGAKVGSEEGERCLRDHRFTLNLLEHFGKHPNMRGVLIEIKGQPVALALAELERGGKVLLSHVEKALLGTESEGRRGIYPFTRRAYLEQWRAEGYEFVNAEQDVGNPGLRTAKQRYRPVELRKKWLISELQKAGESHAACVEESTEGPSDVLMDSLPGMM